MELDHCCPAMHRHALTFELHAAKLNLGCFQRYRKSTRHGNLATRLKEAILAGPLQVALYGSEISYIGEKSVKGLRSATSKVLACSNHGTNHKVAILSYHGGICDPKVQIVLRAIRTARRAYWKFPEQYNGFISFMCANNGDCRKAWGPAGTLASYLNSLRISIDSHGFLSLAEQDLQVHLFRSGFTAVRNFILQAWSAIVQQDITKRKHLHDAPAVDPALTGHYIDKLGANEARTIRTYLSGGFTTEECARHWANTDENCRLCGEVDTLAHRLQTCDATANARQHHQVLGRVDQVRAEAPWARYSPAGYQLTHLWDSLALPCIVSTFDDGPRGRIIYTDGTCDHPKDTQIAQAAWSIVADPSPGIEHVQAAHAQLHWHIQEMHLFFFQHPRGRRQSVGQNSWPSQLPLPGYATSGLYLIAKALLTLPKPSLQVGVSTTMRTIPTLTLCFFWTRRSKSGQSRRGLFILKRLRAINKVHFRSMMSAKLQAMRQQTSLPNEPWRTPARPLAPHT